MAWRLDQTKHASSWDSGYGAALVGGRWNKPKQELVYASLDPALCLLEKAVHTTFDGIDKVAHTMTKFSIEDLGCIFRLLPNDFPNPNWLRPCAISTHQQEFLLPLLQDTSKPFVLVPSVISPSSWNVLFDPAVAKGKYRLEQQDRYALDPRFVP
jgi:RES domain-containing protein